MECPSPKQGCAYGSVSIEGDAHGSQAPQGRLGRMKRRYLMAVVGILSLVGAHCLSGYVIYQHLHRGVSRLVSDGDAFVKDLGHGVIANLESSVVQKSVTHEVPSRPRTRKTEFLPPKTIRRDILNGWWTDLKPRDSSLRQEGEAFLSAYKSVQKEKVRLVPAPSQLSHDAHKRQALHT